MALSVDNLLNRLSALDDATLEMLDKARRANDLRTALIAVRESRGNIEVYSRIGVVSELEARLARLEQGGQSEDSDNEDE